MEKSIQVSQRGCPNWQLHKLVFILSRFLHSTNWTTVYLQEQQATSIQDILWQLSCSAAFPEVTQVGYLLSSGRCISSEVKKNTKIFTYLIPLTSNQVFISTQFYLPVNTISVSLCSLPAFSLLSPYSCTVLYLASWMKDNIFYLYWKSHSIFSVL